MRIHRLFSITLLLLSQMAVWGNIITYTPDDTTVFCNPERGFYHHTEQKVTTAGTTNLSKSTFTSARSEGHTLLLRLYYLDNFRTKDLPDAVLNQITSDFDLFRQNGCKAVLRFAYTNDNKSWPIKDATPARWKSHLTQLKPILQANADVIAVVQAGFMGAWGEWYFSSQGTGEEIPQKVKNELIDQLLYAVPASRCVQLRTPDYKRDYFNYRKESKDALTSAEAFSGSTRARLGHHNDAFLYQSDNMGTYSDREVDMNYLDQECMYLPNGGETDVYKETVYKSWATGDKAQVEMAKLHYSYLNEGYAELTLNHWREDGSFTILDRNMGYRLQLVESNIPSEIAINSPLSVNIAIRNAGYATMYNQRKAYLVLKNSSKTYALLLNTDPRRWMPNGAITQLTENLSLPSDIQTGTYKVYLWLPDMGDKIKDDSRFAVRFANKDVWDDATGYNSLNTTIRISQQGGGKDPDPEPSSSVNPVTNLAATAGTGMATLTWTNPSASSSQVVPDLSTGVEVASSSASANVSCSNKTSTVAYTTTEGWEYAGVEVPVNNLQDITSISFEYKGNGTNNVLYPYAWDDDYRWRDDEYYTLESTDWQTITFTPSTALWADEPSHDFGDQPITKIGFIVNPAAAASGTFQIRNLTINLASTTASDFAGVRIIRKEDSAPTSYSDGAMVYYGKDETYVDKGLSSGTYYYAAYAITSTGEIAVPATCSVTIENTGIDELQASPENASTKVFYQGRAYILNNGTLYNLLGQEVR